MPTKTKIESLGVYLPPKAMTTEELMQKCVSRPRLDLEKFTGVAARRVAEGEYAKDLAIKAAQRALAMSQYKPEDLDVIVCTSISKHNAPDEFSWEPSTAVMVRKAVGAKKALVFDIVNACAGMLNGVYVVQGLIRAGLARCGMVVSGEQNLPLSETATREVSHSFDKQMAALTLGDCGAAIILDASMDPKVGFHWLDLVTGAKHDHFCYSQPSKKGKGGVLMTKARGLQRKGAEHFPFYLKQALDETGWSLDDVHHAIPHQIGPRGIRNGIKVVKRWLRMEVPDFYISVADKYGNTTTTSHFLAIHEAVLGEKILAGHNLLLISGASGIVITHATLTLDDLPDRYRAAQKKLSAQEAA